MQEGGGPTANAKMYTKSTGIFLTGLESIQGGVSPEGEAYLENGGCGGEGEEY